jgi:hypothetical protein
MRKFIPFIALCLCFCDIYAQITEAYPTSQRYLFNPYNRDSVYIDSTRHYRDIFVDLTSPNHTSGDFFHNDIINYNEYQMYPVSNISPVQVYGVALPLRIIRSIPLGMKYFGYYWESDNLGPRDDSIRNLYWQTFVDSMHVLWSSVTYDLTVSGEREIHERFIYFVKKTDDSGHPIIITDSVKIQYGINAVGWNRLQLPKLYNCMSSNYAHLGGYIVPTLEVYFDRPHNVNDTFFVGNTVFLTEYGVDENVSTYYTSVPPFVATKYITDYAPSFNGLFRSDNGDFIPRQTCEYPESDPRWWRPARYPGSIDNSYMDSIWGGPMAIVAPPPCMVPNELRMTQVGYDSATVEWNIPVGVSHCRLEYGPQGFAPGSGTVVDSLTVGRFLMQGLDENTAYEVRVACWCIYAEEYSDTVSVGFRTAYACPPVPAVTNCAVTDTTIALSWWMPDSADYTDVEYGPAGFAEGEGTSKPHITRNYYGYGTLMMSGLEPRTAYEVRMRNYCSHSDAMSEWFSFDTMTTWTDTTTEGINAILQQQVSLRPNPATTRVQVASPVAMTRIVVTDLQGRTLLELPVMADTAEFDTSTWPRGTVIVTIHTPQGKAVKKLALK